ncbi:unnamed protein product [Brugia timori]|uniref:Uncharacterized protein n=1 Tax=Brugia timori TaxID=42155 RepID=A0A0R3QJZ5_9BILA|nr:unnamed protein product [Brugia timori]
MTNSSRIFRMLVNYSMHLAAFIYPLNNAVNTPR